MHHLSGLGRATCQCWGPVSASLFLEEGSILGADLILKKRSIFGARALGGRKEARRKKKKKGKSACMRKSNVTRMQTGQNMLGLGFLTNIVMDISQ
jgi:hypothetical protein